MRQANSSYAHITFQVSLTNWVKFEPKFYARAHPTPMVSLVFPMGRPINFAPYMAKNSPKTTLLSFSLAYKS